MTVCIGSIRIVAGRMLLLGSITCSGIMLSSFSRPSKVFASARTDRKLGGTLFHERGCEHCHGVDGVGTERGPNLSGAGRLLHKPDIERQIRNGGKEMPAFAESLTNDEVQQLVAYVAAKKKKGVKLSPLSGPVLKAG